MLDAQRPDEVRVGTTPIGVEGMLHEEVPLQGVALVLSLQNVPWA